jgi:hypothetical protein
MAADPETPAPGPSPAAQPAHTTPSNATSRRINAATEAFLETNWDRLTTRLAGWFERNPGRIPVVHYKPDAQPPSLRMRALEELDLRTYEECPGLEAQLRGAIPPGSWYFLAQYDGAHQLVIFAKVGQDGPEEPGPDKPAEPPAR